MKNLIKSAVLILVTSVSLIAPVSTFAYTEYGHDLAQSACTGFQPLRSFNSYENFKPGNVTIDPDKWKYGKHTGKFTFKENEKEVSISFYQNRGVLGGYCCVKKEGDPRTFYTQITGAAYKSTIEFTSYSDAWCY